MLRQRATKAPVGEIYFHVPTDLPGFEGTPTGEAGCVSSGKFKGFSIKGWCSIVNPLSEKLFGFWTITRCETRTWRSESKQVFVIVVSDFAGF